jgi:hypothetical protein
MVKDVYAKQQYEEDEESDLQLAAHAAKNGSYSSK